MEYASADAVRRGAPKAKREDGVVPYKGRESKSHGSPERSKHRRFQNSSKFTSEQSSPHSVPVVEKQPHPKQAHTEGDGERRQSVWTEKKIKGPRVRPKPGAALALAKRETAAILPSQGKKITF